jgi:hypothetical protein
MPQRQCRPDVRLARLGCSRGAVELRRSSLRVATPVLPAKLKGAPLGRQEHCLGEAKGNLSRQLPVLLRSSDGTCPPGWSVWGCKLLCLEGGNVARGNRNHVAGLLLQKKKRGEHTILS